MKQLLHIAVLTCLALPSVADEPDDSLSITPNDGNYEAWRDHILPTTEESAFQALPWKLTFAEGLAAAAEQDRPLFLWVMNGHPLGCT